MFSIEILNMKICTFYGACKNLYTQVFIMQLTTFCADFSILFLLKNFFLLKIMYTFCCSKFIENSEGICIILLKLRAYAYTILF